MAEIAFLLLCHKDPDGIIAQAERLTDAGDFLAIHFDARAHIDDYKKIRKALADNPNVVFANSRLKCGWGEWSLVAASLLAAEAALAAFPTATHFYMLSGDCMAIKSSRFAHDYLDAADLDYIESVDFLESDWIKTGLKEDRLIYRHVFNERLQKKWFYRSLDIQKRLGLSRKIPADIRVMIGSQWWCLRRRTLEKVLDFGRRRKDVMRFFKTTWIPDETFFQTLVRHLVPSQEIRSRTLTFLMFSDYGMPVTFHNDHHDLLVAQDYLFARKISAEAKELRGRLGDLYATQSAPSPVTNEGRNLYRFLTERGRVGRRVAPRIWEAEAKLGHQKQVYIMICKKWHVAKRLLHGVRRETGMPVLAYLFDEQSTELPHLGGIGSSLAKRRRHCRAYTKLLFDDYVTDRLLFCIDPSGFDLIKHFHEDKATIRLLEIRCNFSDSYLMGHAQRVGIVGPQAAADTMDRLMPTVRVDLQYESDHIREADFPNIERIHEDASVNENADSLARFLNISPEAALRLAATSNLFSD